ncbi:50S ribosomal protein L6 [bacterium E08(2017)]|nr:50S ribosomal protein L6 [bacterium E08(2017)]
MSRVGQKPIDIESGATVTVTGQTVSVKGKLGELSREVPEAIKVEVADNTVVVTRVDDTKQSKSYHGLIRTLVANMIEGVSKGYTKELEINGVGFKAQCQGQKVILSLGFASPIEYMAPDGVTVTEEGGTKVTVTGMDKQKVGDTAARIRSFFPAEPYKGKGIKYKDERVRRKVGKAVA